jgi:hypothetical protein
MPGTQEIGLVADDESAEPRTHEPLRGRRLRVPAVKTPTTLVVRRGQPTVAALGGGHALIVPVVRACRCRPVREQEATASARPALGLKAFEYGRRSLTDLVSRGDDLGQILHDRYPREALAAQFHERLMNARQALAENRPELLGG